MISVACVLFVYMAKFVIVLLLVVVPCVCLRLAVVALVVDLCYFVLGVITLRCPSLLRVVFCNGCHVFFPTYLDLH